MDLKHLLSAASGALPVLIALETVPGTLGKVAAILVAALTSVLNRQAKPIAKPEAK